MAIMITDKIPNNRRQEIAHFIYGIVVNEPALTSRSISTLLNLFETNGLIIAFNDDKVIGWLASELLTRDTRELGMAYIKPKFREQGIFEKMIEFSIRDGKLTYIAATYSEKILKQLLKYGFVKTTTSELCRRSRYKFLLKRLRFKLIKKIAKRLSEKKVFCALREPIE